MGRSKKPETLDKLAVERDRSQKELRDWEDRSKILKHQQSEHTRRERTNRLCTRDGMLESFLEKPEQLPKVKQALREMLGSGTS